ncbi:MAG: hypothetical protein AAGE85_14010 [Pseudomonadota bacterium]
MKRLLALSVLAWTLTGCGRTEAPPAAMPDEPPDLEASIDDLARQYLYLELAMGEIDAAHVDAYFGPPEIAARAEADAPKLPAIRSAAQALSAELRTRLAASDGSAADRVLGLLARLRALDMRIAVNAGESVRFDDESDALFMAVAPRYDAAHFETILAEIDALVPGDGDLSARVNAFREQFVIPVDRLPAVFEEAMAECRRRTLERIALPEGESFTIEYVTDKPWSGYNWYQGNAQSLIQINTDLPIFIERAVDLGCHEGYPGHHTYNALLEQNLVNESNWVEFSLYPLFSPQSLIAEGSANYGIKLAFPGSERLEYETATLFPLAGLDAGETARYYELLDLLAKLNYAGNEAARGYLNGEIDVEEAADWLVRYALNSPERAAQRVRFFDAYRSYVINYNLGKDKVKAYIESGDADHDERWRRFEAMLSSPILPDSL